MSLNISDMAPNVGFKNHRETDWLSYLIVKKMTEKLEQLKLKRCGQRGTVTKNRQEANSLLVAGTLEPLSTCYYCGSAGG